MNAIQPIQRGSYQSTYNCNFDYYWSYNVTQIGLTYETNVNSIPNITVGNLLYFEEIYVGTVKQLAYDGDANWWVVTLDNATPYTGVRNADFYNSVSSIRYADFVRLTTADATYLFSTAPNAIKVPSVDSTPFAGLGQLVQIGSVTRDIKSTANETSFTLVGIDTAMLALVLGAGIKGSKIEAWHGFFDTNGSLINNQLYYSDFVNYWEGYCGDPATNVTHNQPDPFGNNGATTIVRNTNTSCGASNAFGLLYSHYIGSYFYTVGDIVTVSVWAKSNSPSATVTMNLGVDDANMQSFTLTTSWVRYSATFTIVASGTGNRGFQFTINAPATGTVSASVYGAQSQLGLLTNYIKTNGTPNSGLYKYFTGYINSFSISEQWMEEIRAYVGAVNVNASSIQIILRNRVAGRYTNDSSWQFFNAGDTSMKRVPFISNINYAFGKNT